MHIIMSRMRIAALEPMKTGKVKRDLAVKSQPYIEEAATSTGIKRELIQNALFQQLEKAGVRIGVATVARLLKDPKVLVDEYLRRVAVQTTEKTLNFERTLKQMLQRSAKAYAVEAFKEIRTKFPQNREFRQLNALGRLMAENKGSALTVVPLPEGVLPVDPENSRFIEGSLVMKDGESVAWRDGKAIGPAEPKDLATAYQAIWGTANLQEDPALVLTKAPNPMQLALAID